MAEKQPETAVRSTSSLYLPPFPPLFLSLKKLLEHAQFALLFSHADDLVADFGDYRPQEKDTGEHSPHSTNPSIAVLHLGHPY